MTTDLAAELRKRCERNRKALGLDAPVCKCGREFGNRGQHFWMGADKVQNGPICFWCDCKRQGVEA